MTLHKRLLASRLIRELLSRLAAAYLRLLYATTRWSLWGIAARDAIKASDKPIIACFWHNRLLLMSYPWQEMRPKPFAMLQSAHRDGRLAARMINHLGLNNIFVERNKSGARAFRNMLVALKGGSSIGFTPDGPRGPRGRMPLAPLLLAQKSGALLYPVTAATTRRRMLNTWDRFLIFFPFGRGIVAYGEPMQIAADADSEALEKSRLEFEQRMNALAASVDAALGFTPIEPA